MGITCQYPLVVLSLALSGATAVAQSSSVDWSHHEADSSTEGELAGATLIDSVAAIVGRRVITLSQLEAEARIALATHGPVEAAEAPLDPAVLGSTLDYVISQDLVEEEASRLGVFPVTAADCELAEERLAARFPTHAAFERFLVRFGIDAERLRASVRRTLRAERYLQHQLGPQAQPSDLEIAAWQARHPAAGPAAQARATARALLSREKYQALTTALVRDLRARADVRILAGFEPAPTAADTPPGLDPGDAKGLSSALVDSPGRAGEP